MKAKAVPIGLLVAALFAGGIGAGVFQFPGQFPKAHAATPAPAAVQTLPDFAAIVEANKAAVVNITASKAKSPENIPLPQPAQGMGSGFIVESDGVILTNAHVVEGADEVRVRLTDRREFKGKVLGADRATDIAVVKIEAKGLSAVRLGDPSKVRVGEWVVAIGSPFGFENTVTQGIVSATSRSLPDGTYVPFIQTDAAVNPGNSGGPLFNLKGEVIGINSQIYSRTGGYQGLAFAVPIDVAANVKQQLVAHGKVERGRIGVSIQEVTQPLAQSFGLDRPRGALVSSVESGSPAEKAGIKAGDVLLAVNGTQVERSAEVPLLVAAAKPGSKVSFDVWRDGSKRALSVTVGELKAEQVAAGARGEAGTTDTGKLGLAVRPSEDGLVVKKAVGPAARAGIRAGDVVTAVNGEATIFVPVEIG
jgi:serine protease Do